MVFDKLKQVNSLTFDETLNIQTTTPAVRFQAEGSPTCRTQKTIGLS